MISIRNKRDRARLRRLALGSQGLLQIQPFGRGLPGACRAIKHIGYVQIDTISVVERAHHHVLFSRVPGYAPGMINRLLERRDIFEYWSHAAAFLPISDYRFSLPYKHAIRNGKVHWYKDRDTRLMNELLTRVRTEGPIRSRDIESETTSRSGWWDWKPTKQALEQLFMEGDLMVTTREGFQKVYDLTERVLPEDVDISMPSEREFAEHLLEQQLRCHGIVSLKGLTYLRRSAELRAAMKAVVDEQVSAGRLQALKVPSGDVYFVETEAFECRTSRVSNRVQILSPFDNSVIQRDRLATLFDFDYQIECYVKEENRQYGYFCLPILYRDEFIGRMDCKAHRKARELEVKMLHLESGTMITDCVMHALVLELGLFALFQQCDSIIIRRSEPKALAATLNTELGSGL
ncbi:MAG: crosslink repair DNA glycosylase YcaQ family protein [Pseudomonadota bacterium]